MNLTTALRHIPARVRLAVYIAVGLVLLAVTAWQTANGNIGLALVTFLGSIQNALAAANTTPTTGKHTDA